MIVLENKRAHYVTSPMLLDVMAQLAEGIAAYTFNRRMTRPQAPILPIFGVVMHGSAPVFCRMPVTNSLRMALKNPHPTPGLPLTTVTYCVPDINGGPMDIYLTRAMRDDPEARRIVRGHYFAFMQLVRGVSGLTN